MKHFVLYSRRICRGNEKEQKSFDNVFLFLLEEEIKSLFYCYCNMNLTNTNQIFELDSNPKIVITTAFIFMWNFFIIFANI